MEKEMKKHFPDSCTYNFDLPETPPSKPEANRQKEARKENTNPCMFLVHWRIPFSGIKNQPTV
jgi:hypothetical protein